MRHSEFDRAVADEFGAGGAALVADLVLTAVGNRTAREALAEGVAPREVWYALCAETDVPSARRHGAGRLEPRR
ncbi:DUF3046 domain-containing protein [Microbacterium oleivorans]|jgi:hypothetical protein|uniref:Signal transduction histidine kinase n=1 Tax=Microbacterium oleivorans TaxID=273677 RepID=A0A031FM01_9MICO|nr:DUF3046 domain-containing protein [Microbacterium oleivorans]AZS43379.1 hypothetical protein BWL13_00934 [Microbacterium oleivorans]EZP25337.1 hypothetical protein BW34_02792 [Microbacterium oleivorans]THE07484.1 DUF3046 domain-containing protein [Microbacterium oleivorans]